MSPARLVLASLLCSGMAAPEVAGPTGPEARVQRLAAALGGHPSLANRTVVLVCKDVPDVPAALADAPDLESLLRALRIRTGLATHHLTDEYVVLAPPLAARGMTDGANHSRRTNRFLCTPVETMALLGFLGRLTKEHFAWVIRDGEDLPLAQLTEGELHVFREFGRWFVSPRALDQAPGGFVGFRRLEIEERYGLAPSLQCLVRACEEPPPGPSLNLEASPAGTAARLPECRRSGGLHLDARVRDYILCVVGGGIDGSTLGGLLRRALGLQHRSFGDLSLLARPSCISDRESILDDENDASRGSVRRVVCLSGPGGGAHDVWAHLASERHMGNLQGYLTIGGHEVVECLVDMRGQAETRLTAHRAAVQVNEAQVAPSAWVHPPEPEDTNT